MPETTALGAAIAAGRASGVDCWNVKEQTLQGQGFVPNNDPKGIYYFLHIFFSEAVKSSLIGLFTLSIKIAFMFKKPLNSLQKRNQDLKNG